MPEEISKRTNEQSQDSNGADFVNTFRAAQNEPELVDQIYEGYSQSLEILNQNPKQADKIALEAARLQAIRNIAKDKTLDQSTKNAEYAKIYDAGILEQARKNIMWKQELFDKYLEKAGNSVETIKKLALNGFDNLGTITREQAARISLMTLLAAAGVFTYSAYNEPRIGLSHEVTYNESIKPYNGKTFNWMLNHISEVQQDEAKQEKEGKLNTMGLTRTLKYPHSTIEVETHSWEMGSNDFIRLKDEAGKELATINIDDKVKLISETHSLSKGDEIKFELDNWSQEMTDRLGATEGAFKQLITENPEMAMEMLIQGFQK